MGVGWGLRGLRASTGIGGMGGISRLGTGRGMGRGRVELRGEAGATTFLLLHFYKLCKDSYNKRTEQIINIL